jgi:crotonobetainyl-CoA:carnitine CoA-transferase CaiB-like acyl-CoA transferase
MAQAFAGIRIIDFTQVLAGPFATQQLALLGAEVIKIEQPGAGDQTRGLMNDPDDPAHGMSPSFLSCNLGKKSLTLDLKAAAAKEIVERLVKDADVVVENFRAGVMDRLGFGYEALREVREDLIYCSVSGYGQRGPKSAVPAYDGAIQADSGMMAITGYPESGPTRTGYMPVDMATAMTTAFAISASLYRRLATGEGQHIDVAMMDTAIVMQTAQVSNFLATGKQPPLLGNRSPTGHPTANSFATADGHINVLALRDHQVSKLFEVIGSADLIDDPRFASGPQRIANYDAMVAILQDTLASQTSAHWIEAFARAGVPAAAIRNYTEVIADDQFSHRNTFIEFPKPGQPGATARLVRAGYQTSSDTPDTPLPPPELGQHSREILGSIGYTDSEIDALQIDGVI